ncbi:MAG: hypothetical protein QFE16_02980 [Pseudomonadota bacterium]|nr:hypothetical protein [Pseudomonadota bacterium]
MISIRHLTFAAAVGAFSLTGYAQTPVDHAAHHPDAAASAAPPACMAMAGRDASAAHMDEHMKLMQDMHDKMMRAKTPDERNALMSEHMKLMQDGMALMGGARSGCMMGRGGMKDKGHMGGDTARQHESMEKRMDMMQSMMQMMMDRLPPAPAKP